MGPAEPRELERQAGLGAGARPGLLEGRPLPQLVHNGATRTPPPLGGPVPRLRASQSGTSKVWTLKHPPPAFALHGAGISTGGFASSTTFGRAEAPPQNGLCKQRLGHPQGPSLTAHKHHVTAACRRAFRGPLPAALGLCSCSVLPTAAPVRPHGPSGGRLGWHPGPRAVPDRQEVDARGCEGPERQAPGQMPAFGLPAQRSVYPEALRGPPPSGVS